jgi:RHS repeat-associated protein
MTSGPNPLHFLSSRSSTVISRFCWKRFSANFVDLARKSVAVLLVYATVAATAPVRADEPFRNTAGTGSSTLVSPSSFLGPQSKVTGASDGQVSRQAAESRVAIPVARAQTLPITADVATVPLRLPGNTASLRSAIVPPIFASTGGSGYDQCIYALDQTAANALYINGAVVINAPSCGVVVDSSSSTALKFSGSGTFTAKYFDVVGGYSTSGSTKFSPTPTTGSTYQSDPLAFLVPPVSSTCNYTNFKVTTGSSTLNPGTYCNGITISGATNVTFNPGMYILMGGGLNVTGASILKGSGITFFLTQGLGYSYGPLSISSSVVATLSAPTSGSYYGILVYQDRQIGTGKAANTFTGASSSSLNGVLYFPTTALTLAGAEAGGNCLIIVADTITLTGAAAIGNGCSGGSPLQPPVTVSVTPATATLYGGQTQQFTATVANTSNTAVTWTISPAGTGTISSSGLYTAPATISAQQKVTVTATSQANTTASASSKVILMPKASQTISFTVPSPVTYPVSPITLSATASSGLPVTFNVVSGPGTVSGSTLTITGVGTVVVAANQAGNTYYSAAPQVTQSVVVNYSTPIANAGPPQTVYVGTTVQLDGTGSSDPAGLPLTYLWSLVSVPSGSTAALSSTTAAKPTFVADKVGTYKVQLIVNNGHNNSAPSTVTITSQHLPPVANAGPPQTVYQGQTVQLNGAGSYDPAGLPITYQWSFVSLPSGSSATLSGATTPLPTFLADKTGNYVVQLIVNNGVFSSTPSTVTITTENSPPVANAGPNQTVNVQSTVQLNGSGSTDVNGDPLTYAWSFVSIPGTSKAVLTNPNSVNPTFVADVSGNYVVQLIVNDGYANSAPATVTISTIYTPPVANAGPNQTITVTGLVQLTGSGSTDVNGNPLTYSWSFLTLPQGSTATLSNPNAVNPTFVADVLGTYVLQLIVNDGVQNSTPATVTITSNDVPPVANPGPAQMATIGSVVNLNGGASTDSDHQQLTYQWSMLSKPPNSSAALSNATSATPYFTPDESGNYVVQLIVNDGYLNSAPATVVISTTYIPPVANAGPNQTVNAGSTVQLSGAASTDTNGNSLTYSWAILSQPNGGTATLSNAMIVNPTFVANLIGTYVVQLIVNDGTSSSAPVTTTITANAQPPVVSAGPNQTITLPVNSVTLNGSATDNGIPLTFAWSVVSGPGAVTFNNPGSAVTTATFGSAGTYVLQLTASNSQNSASATTTVTVNPQAYVPPIVNAGPSQTITLPTNTVMLNGSASDNGVPMTTVWTAISGPGTVSLSSPNSLATQATFPSTPGTYVLQLSASNTQYTSTAQVTITVNPGSIQPPVVSAGPNQTITLPTNTVTLNGTASDGGVPMTVAWSVVSGPTTVTFSSPSTVVTQATFTAPGAYVLQLSASNAQYTTTSQTAVYVYTQGNGQNQPPYVNAGPNQTITLPAAAQLNGVAVDDGLPNGTLTISWSLVSGPGTVTFASTSSPVTTASFSTAGTYVLQLAADDSQYLSTSNVTITVGKIYGHGGYKGTDFWLTFPMNYDDGASACCGSVFQPQLLITSDVNNSGSVTIPGVSFSTNFTLSAGQGTSVQIPTNAALSSNDVVENYGIHVTSQSEITVVGFSYYTASSDGYLALPTPVLGTSYIVMAYPYAYYGSELAIVAAQDGTTVTVTPSVTVLGRAAGQPYNIILNQGRTYELITTGGQDDLTGTIITSDKPIAVWGGNQAAAVPDATWRYLNHIVEELLPTDLWGENFLVEPYANQPNGDIVRVQAAQNGTNVSINGSPVATLNQGQFYEEFETAPVSINASAPIQVAQFETGEEYQTHTPFGGPPYGTFLGDPSMTLISAYEQFGGHYTVLIPTTGFPSNYVNVVAPTSSLSGLSMDGAPLSATFTPIPNSVYSGAQVPVSTGVHYFDGTAPFGVTVTGFAAYDAYSYQAGLAFDAARAGTTIVLTPTTVTQQTGTQICFTASLLDAYGNPPGGIGVGFTVTGANVSNQSVDSNVSGQSQYCYTGTNSGTDTILASIGGATATGSVTWNANAPNRAPFVYPGSDQVITLPSSANLLGVISDDGLPLGSTLTIAWSEVSGPGTVSFANASQPVTTASFSAAGTYDLRLTANDSQLSSYADLTITVNAAPQVTAPVVNPGPNQTVTLPLPATLNGIVTDNVLPPNGMLIAQWAEVSGPSNASPVVFANPSSAYTTATFNQAGTYVLSLTGDNSQLQTTAQVTITVLPAVVPPAVICPNGGSFATQFPTNTITLNCTISDSNLPQGGTLTQQWTQSSGPAVVSFATPSQATTVATFPVAGSYTLYLTADNTLLTTAQEVFVTVSPANTPPVVDITNSYQTITLPTNTATLNATVTDDSPQGNGTLTQLWTQTSGPTATISTPTAASTQVTLTTVGQYNFQLAATYAQYTTTAGATVVVNPAPVAPTVYAGPNQTITLPTNAVTLNGTISNPGVPTNATITTAWSELSGPTAVTFGSPASPSTQATFTAAGTYVLQLAGTNTGLTGTSTLTVTVYSAPQNLPPVVSAGPSFTVSAGITTYIAGTATDPAGLPLTIAWSQLSGPAQTTIYYLNSAATYVSFPVVGTYVLQLSASDPNLTATATVTAVVTPSVNQPPSVSAGGYQTITLPTNTLTLNGYASTSSGTLVVAWSEVSGPAMVTFSNPNQPVTQATFPVAGSYQLQLAGSANQLTSISNTYITVNPADSGPSISFSSSNVNSLTLPNATTTLAANITLNAGSSLSVTWSEYDGPGPVTFSSPNSTVTDATFAVAGTYYLQLAASDGTITNTSSLTIYVKAAPVGGPPVVSLNTPQDGQQVTGPLAITGMAYAQTENQGGQTPTWTLAYSLNTQDGASTQTWTTIAESNYFTQAPQTLATLDPTVLLNGTYSLQLTATDSYGQMSSTSTTFVVSKNAKPGDFTLSFNDLTVPVAGLPITVTRSYDSLDHGFHDFGPSWSLSLSNIHIEKSRNLGKNWLMNGTSGGLFGSYCVQSAANVIVTVTFPGGTQYLFQAVATPACSEIVPPQSATIGFTELPGSSGTAGATLVPADGGQVIFDNSGSNFNLLDYEGNPYNPTQFILTTRDGHSFTIDQSLGVSFMSDASGNSLTIGSSGIVSSTGKSITFTRDSLNRITKITDPNGNTLQYNYTSSTSSGTLEQFIDASGNTTTFNYNYLGSFGVGIPELSSITNAQGVTVAAAQYDSAGHMTQLTDAYGKTTGFNINENTQTEIVTDALGNPTTYTYDADGNVLTETDALGNSSTNTYDSDDNKLTATDPLGHTTTYTYDASDNRLTQTDSLGNTTSFTYNQGGQALTATDPLGHTTTNVYDANGNLTSTTDANGKTTSTVYSSNGLPTSLTDANGKTTQFQYDGSGNLTQQTDALNNVTTYTYDANNNRLSQTVTRTVNGQPQALTTNYQYDGNNRPTQTTYPDGSTTQTQYNSIGKQSVTIDQLGHQTSYTYDSDGRPITTTYPDNTTQSTTYDADSNRLTSTDRAGHTTSYTYDADNHLIKTTYADSSFTQTNYDAAGRVNFTIDADNNTTSYGYDNANRRTSLTDALSHVTNFTYDNSGNQIALKDARGNTTQYLYDALNRQIAVVYPDQTTSTSAYDNLGHVISKTDQAGKVTAYGYDAIGHLTSATQDAATGGLNLVTTYGYDQVGNRMSQTDANNHTTTYVYDQLGRRIGRTLPAGQSESYTYDAAGNLKTKIDFNGKTTTYVYDTSNRLLSKTPDPSFNAPAVSFTYTSNGLRQTMLDVSGTTTYGYDTRNHLTSKQTPFGTLSYSYDAAGNLLTLKSSNSGGGSDTYTYDQLNRLSTVTDASGGTTYAYDAVGNLQNFVYPNGVTHAYSYDTLNRLTQMGASANAAALSNYAYTLGAAGNRTSVAELSGRTVAYAYDSLYRLMTETVSADPNNKDGAINYTYDAVGNRKTLNATLPPAGGMSYTYDADDRLGSDQYDADGNTISSFGTANTYDFENRLTTHGGVTIVYDGDGNRVSETVGGVTTNYLVDTVNPTGYAQVVDELQSGTVTRTYSYGLERIGENQILNSAWTPSFYGYDGHGSVRQLTNSTGVVTDTYDYDAFGNQINSTGSTPNNYLFAGEQYDPALGLYYNRARYLNTTTGRFWSMDTQQGNDRDPLSLHKYLYSEGDPVDHLDPGGNQIDDLVGSFALDMTLNAISTIQLPGGSVGSFVASLFIPSWVLQGIANSTPDAVALGASGQVSVNTGVPVGVTGFGGFEFLGSPKTGKTALYSDFGAGLSFGSTATSGGLGGYVGLVFNCPSSADYTGNFVNVTIPIGALSSQTRTTIETQLLQVNIAAIVGGVPVGYASLLAEITNISVTEISSNTAITFFWSPDKPDEVGWSVGASTSGSLGASTSNWALTASYYYQLAPPQSVPFR